MTKKRIVDATLCKLDVLDAWLRKTLEERSKHSVTNEMTERDSEVDIRIKASALLHDLMTASNDIGSQMKGLQIGDSSSSSSAAGEETTPSNGATTTSGDLELEVYVKLLCNPTLPAHIIQTP